MPNDRASASVLITAGAAGIGLATAEHFVAAGHHVILVDRNPAVENVAKRLGSLAEGLVADLQQEAEVLEVAGYARSRMGGCDILVNNAGMHPKKDGRPFRMEEIQLGHWDEVFRLNVTTPFLLCRELIPSMRNRGWGRVINVASRVGRTYVPFAGLHYSASKAALIGMTKQLGGENAEFGITVNCVVPGRIDTPQSEQFAPEVAARLLATIPANRWGTPDEVAGAIAYLASEQAGYITGTCLDINGGAFIG